jgi:hypothetical protein
MFFIKGSREPEPGPGDWTLEIHDRPDGSMPYKTFRASLDEYTRAVLDISVKYILAKQGHNVCASLKFGRNLKRGLYEFKIGKPLATICNEFGIQVPPQFSDGKPVLLRIFFAVEGARIVLLLGGYDKKKDDSEKRQIREIGVARALLAEHKERQKREKKKR